jgi:hypothetical protein
VPIAKAFDPGGSRSPTGKPSLANRPQIDDLQTFGVEELNRGRNWRWVGPFSWLRVHYGHQFARIGPEETELRFVVDGEGLGVALFGRIFAAIYARNLDQAIPNLIRELEQRVD